MSQGRASPSSILQHAEPTHLMSLVPRALLWSLRWASLSALVYTFLAWFHANWSPDAEPLPLSTANDFLGVFNPANLNWPGIGTLLGKFLTATGVLVVLLFPCRLLWTSPAMDTAFKGLGFLATFFGLTMLAFFFGSLSLDVYRWFQVTRFSVAIENQNLEKLSRELNNVQQLRAEKAKELQAEMQLAIEGEETPAGKAEARKLYETRVIPETLKAEDQKIAELRISSKKGQRADTSGFALLGHFLLEGASRSPQDSGIYYALMGSLLVAFITLLFAVPVGVAAALYLEEYRSKGWFGHLIQLNINNLAGVPSVVYGILGGFVFVELIFKRLVNNYIDPTIPPRNGLGGGLTLGLLTLPIVIVSAQEAIRAVPRSIRDGAYALGATQWQTIWRNVLPMASPGIMTGTILSLSRAIGEAAPMILFGALLYVSSPPGLLERFTVVPMQVFAWVEQPRTQVELFAQSQEQLRQAIASAPEVPALIEVRANTAGKLDAMVAWIPDLESSVNIIKKVLPGEEYVKPSWVFESWQQDAAMGIVILLLLLLAMNAFAIWLRNRTQQKMRY